ncbi:Inositol transport system ATP-binding protein [Pseudomonas sp. FEN]|nr:Inositol transport system ATP-binding protein [Pseudomonas sp. FEN]
MALSDVQLRVRPGSVLALMGENGAGKSTLMKIIAGIYQPDAGELRLRGKPVIFETPLAALQSGIAMIHQELNLMPHMSVAENIWIGREQLNGLRMIDHGEMHRCTAKLLERLRINLDPEEHVGNLSIAERQMVEIAKAVSYDSDILIMDEPTSAITDKEVAHLFSIIADLKAQGKGIIYITHKMNEVFAIADEVAVFRDGAYIGLQRADSMDGDSLISMMVGRELSQLFPVREKPIGKLLMSVRDLRLEGIFQGVSFDLHAGEILGIAGLMGSGRTNVAEALFGITPSDGGEIHLDGLPVRISDPHLAIEKGFALLTRTQAQRPVSVPLGHGKWRWRCCRITSVATVSSSRRPCAPCAKTCARSCGENPVAGAMHRHLVRWQPAKGLARPLADDQPTDPDSRRADPRYRRRRQGRDLPVDRLPRQRRHGGDHDFLGTAGSARHE